MKVNFITTWYSEPEPKRRAELAFALAENVTRPQVARVHILDTPHRLTFAELVTYGDDGVDVINLLINTDCYIVNMDHLEQIDDKSIWCLSRTDNCCACSQDAWVWRGRLVVPHAKYTQGVPGCDNRFAYDAACTGRIPSNPSLTIAVAHVHSSGKRNYSEKERITPPYLWVEPVSLGDRPRLGLRGRAEDSGAIAHLKDFMEDIKV